MTKQTPTFVLLGMIILAAGSGACRMNDQSTKLWEIGEADGTSAGLALAPANYKEFREDGFFVVGLSEPAQAWPCLHPGPYNAWAGSRQHTYSIYFLLKGAATTGEGRLTIDLAETHWDLPSRLRVAVNDQVSEHQLPVGGSDAVLAGDFSQAKPHKIVVTVPASALKAGTNRIDITSVTGSWCLYDRILFEAPPGVTLTKPESFTGLVVRAQPAIMERDGRKLQSLAVEIRHAGSESDATLAVPGAESESVHLRPGVQRLECFVPAVRQPRLIALRLEQAGKPIASHEVRLLPVRDWVVYILPHSHVDIGYTAVQSDVERKQMEHIDTALSLAQKSAAYPPEARFKWNTEVLWAVDSYLRQASPEKQEALVKAVKAGSIGLDAMYANILTGLCRPEELLQMFDCAKRLEQRCGVPVESAMISDIPGYTWGTVSAMAQAGIKYWSIGPNLFDRIGTTLSEWQDQPFYWIGPNGRDKVLCWIPFKGYSLGHFLEAKLTPHLFEILSELEQAKYPYDATYLRWNVHGDNGGPDENLSDAVRDWNAKYSYPKLIIATTREAFAAFEQRYGDRLPRVRGDWTPYWEDGACSTARETALNRNTADRLVQAETLWALRDPARYPVADFEAAWRYVLLYSEHTWGAHNSIREPDCDFVKEQWRVKKAYADEADARSRKLLADIVSSSSDPQARGIARTTAGPATAIDVLNTCSWPRTDLVLVERGLSPAGNLVTGSDGQPVPSQRLSTGELAFVARDVPPFGALRYVISAGMVAPPDARRAAEILPEEGVVRNGALTLQIDRGTGEISSLRTSERKEDLVDHRQAMRLNCYQYLLGSNPADAQTNESVRIGVKERGPVVASLLIQSDAPGCRALFREVRLVAGLDRADIINTVDKLPVRQKEGVHFGFAFNIPDGAVRLDIPWTVIRPEVDQMPGACKNWLTAGRYLDVSNDRYGVTLVTQDAPLVELGSITATLIGSQPDPKVWLTHLEPTQTVYSWVMNNFWHTNYKADQGGSAVFRYALWPHGKYDPAACERLGIGYSQPLVVVPARMAGPLPSRLRVEPSDVLATVIKGSRDGKALIVRLFGASGEPRNASLTWSEPQPSAIFLSDLSERAGERVSGPIDVPGWGIVTLRVELPVDQLAGERGVQIPRSPGTP
jgi:alpha-mannosidase